MRMIVASRIWHVIRLIWRDECLRLLASLGGMVMFPLALTYLGFRLAQGSAELEHRYFAAGLTLAFGSNVLQTGIAILDDRFSGRLVLLRACAVSKLSYYASRTVLGVAKTIALVTILLAIGRLGGYVDATAAALAGSLFVATVAGGSLSGLAAVIAVRASTFDKGLTLLALCAVGIALMSPLYYSFEAVPRWLQPLLLLSPYTYLPPQIIAVIEGRWLPVSSMLAAALLGISFNVIGYRSFDWSCAAH
jgi:hypothetical protein